MPLPELASKANEKLSDAHLQGIEDDKQLDGIDSSVSGLDLRHPCLSSANEFTKIRLCDSLLLPDGSQQLHERGVVVTGWG